MEVAIMEELAEEEEEPARYKNPWAPNGRWRFVPEGDFGAKFPPSNELRGAGGGQWKQQEHVVKKEGWWVPVPEWKPPPGFTPPAGWCPPEGWNKPAWWKEEVGGGGVEKYKPGPH